MAVYCTVDLTLPVAAQDYLCMYFTVAVLQA